jgi:protein-tyrosine phosphatase
MSHERAHLRVTTVCWGNICRSPMAEFVLREAFADAGLGDEVVVDSAGTSTEELGRPMDQRTVAALVRHGIPDRGFGQHRARQFTAASFANTDLVLAADHVHDRILRERAPSEADRDKVALLRSFDPAAVASGTLGMDDPWYGDDSDFDTTFTEIESAAPGIVAHVRALLAARP